MIGYHPATLMSGGAQPAAGVDTTLVDVEQLVRELYERARPEKLGVSQSDFRRMLQEVVRKYGGAGATDAAEVLRSLNIEDLVLARACAAGDEKAWEIFLTRYREKLYDAAGAIAKDDATARELADSLYADLYGMGNREGERVSKLASYAGRGSLIGWLRTVLAQEFVNRYRTQRRLVSLEQEEESGQQFAAPAGPAILETNPRLEQATDEALGAVPAEDRYILSAYYLDRRTLAEIARTLGAHESTISRKLEKITAALRKRIRENLMRRGMSRRQAEEAMQVDVRDVTVNVRSRLAQESPAGSFSAGQDPRQGSELP